MFQESYYILPKHSSEHPSNTITFIHIYKSSRVMEVELKLFVRISVLSLPVSLLVLFRTHCQVAVLLLLFLLRNIARWLLYGGKCLHEENFERRQYLLCTWMLLQHKKRHGTLFSCIFSQPSPLNPPPTPSHLIERSRSTPEEDHNPITGKNDHHPSKPNLKWKCGMNCVKLYNIYFV